MLGFFSLPYSANYINHANLEDKLFLVKVLFSLDIYEGSTLDSIVQVVLRMSSIDHLYPTYHQQVI